MICCEREVDRNYKFKKERTGSDLQEYYNKSKKERIMFGGIYFSAKDMNQTGVNIEEYVR